MSFIINNLDSSRPNLPIGEILETQLRTEIASWKAYLDANSPNTNFGRMDVYRQSGELYWMSLSYTEEEVIRASVIGDPTNSILGAEMAKQIYINLKRTAHQLYLPNLYNRFNSLWVSDDTDEFDFNIKMVTAYRSFYGLYETHFEGNGATDAAHVPYTGESNYTKDRAELLQWGGEYSIAFKYFGDIERSISVAKDGGYVVYSVIPKVYTTREGKRIFAGVRMEIFFPQYNNQSATHVANKRLFNNADLTSETITHLNDLPDDQNTYPGGAADKNEYPEDTEDGLNSSGYGTFDNTNDPVDFPSMPLWDATSTGFISMWNPTITELSDLYSFLWDSDISTTLKKLFLEPMDAIISLALFPVDPILFEGKRHVTIGHVDTEIEMNVVQKQFVDFDFGTIILDEYYGAAWDYSPYTKVSIYLPYIGSQELDVDDVMNATLNLKYRIDLLSGMCVAMLKATRSRDGLDAVVYTWQGNCGMQVPITAGSAREFINSIIQLGAMTGLALVNPAAGAVSAGASQRLKGTGAEFLEGGVGNFVNPTMATFSALNVLGQKVHVQRGGRVDANAGVMSVQSAYIIINRPVSAIPRGWNEFAGYPSLKIKELISQKGFTQVAYIKLNGLEATAEEITELDTILKDGVIL